MKHVDQTKITLEIQEWLCFHEGAKGEIAQNTTSYLRLAPLTGERKSVREKHNSLVLLKLLCVQ